MTTRDTPARRLDLGDFQTVAAARNSRPCYSRTAQSQITEYLWCLAHATQPQPHPGPNVLFYATPLSLGVWGRVTFSGYAAWGDDEAIMAMVAGYR